MQPKHQSNHFRKPAIGMSLVMLLVMLVSCNPPSLQAATATPLPSLRPLPPLNTPTPSPAIPTLSATPTITPTASSTATPSGTSVVFSTGATTTLELGTIQPNQVQSYSLSANQNQVMILFVNSPNNDVYLGVTEPDGNSLLDPANKQKQWKGLLPATEFYTIQLYGGVTSENYMLQTTVAEQVVFPADSNSLTLTGSTPGGLFVVYVVSCKANQIVTVSLNVPISTAYLNVSGLATGKLLHGNEKAASWTGTLPTDENYIIEVVPVNGQVVNYTLTVNVK